MSEIEQISIVAKMCHDEYVFVWWYHISVYFIGATEKFVTPSIIDGKGAVFASQIKKKLNCGKNVSRLQSLIANEQFLRAKSNKS